ncbi:hypothetical protein BDR03DRAFT_1006834 [Suillus americanus]|nr:hypothetical protein BDR03DRAFT_1006834 [Suillus americanus]
MATIMEKIPSATDKKSLDVKEEKSYCVKGDVETSTRKDDTDENVVLQNEREIATHVISVDDDPSLNPWTFRAFFIGLGLSAFGGSLAQIYYFKPVRVP